MPDRAPRNALANETSPYLLQHADNPVEWFPWSPEPLARAREQDRPILLSIGYSACHWCHVMAHESFEDDETAALMNALYVNIKVDREERPDLDKIYQSAHQILLRRPGGWPLTMFLTPDDHAPFFAGTYFPDRAKFSMPAFRQVLTRVSELFHDRREDIRLQNNALVDAMRRMEPETDPAARIDGAPLDRARDTLLDTHDEVHGGFGSAPKFPHPTHLDRLLRGFSVRARTGNPDRAALDAAVHTFSKMASGGVFDHVGGGFCRYSVDEYWMIPHFEKMLYDNGPLLSLATELWQLTANPTFERTARETAGWVIREMQGPQGGYYSTLDADSEGEEGRFYVWQPEEVRELLTTDEYAVVSRRFGLDREPNFEGRHWHLHSFEARDDTSRTLGIGVSEAEALEKRALAKLFAARSKRIRPGLDDKILTSWNGLMIKGMAIAGRALGEPRYIESAERALAFVRETMFVDGRLLATCKDGRAHLRAYLDDHACMIDGILALLAHRWSREDFDFAHSLCTLMLERFHDPRGGGFYFTANDHEALLHRPKPMQDDALPSGNGVAATVLARMGHLTGETRFLDAAEGTLRAGWSGLSQYPHAHNALLVALEEYLAPPQTIVIRGEADALERWAGRANRRYAPARVVLPIPSSESALPGLLEERRPRGEAVAYLCEGHVCESPIESFEDFEAALRASETHPID